MRATLSAILLFSLFAIVPASAQQIGVGAGGGGGGGSGDITDVWGCTAGNCNALTGATGDSFNATSASSSIPQPASTTLPATCLEGFHYQDTDAGGTETYVCTATDTWTKFLAATDNAATATALAANGANCDPGEAPLGVDASGAVEGCFTAGGTTLTDSASLAAALSDETGTGAAVFANSPTLVTPALGTPSALVLTNATGLPIATGVSGLGANVATLLGTFNLSNLNTALSDADVARTDAANTFTGTQSYAGVLRGSDGTKTAPTYSFTNATGNGMYWRSGIGLGVAGNSGKEILQVSSTGGLSLAGSTLALSSTDGIDLSTTSADVILGAEAAAVLQLGEDAATATPQTIKTHDGLGTDKVGANLVVTPGSGTGVASGGSFLVKTASAGGVSNATQNAMTTRLTISSTGLAAFTDRITSSRGTDLGWSVQAAANQACNTTCTNAAVMGFDATNGIVGPTDATADQCLCAGTS